jgi:hypothetical protein
MARIKTNRTERITLMLSPEVVRYLVNLAAKREVTSLSAIAEQTIKEHQASFFDISSTEVECTTEIEQLQAA